jgi:hypothetical protein
LCRTALRLRLSRSSLIGFAFHHILTVHNDYVHVSSRSLNIHHIHLNFKFALSLTDALIESRERKRALFIRLDEISLSYRKAFCNLVFTTLLFLSSLSDRKEILRISKHLHPTLHTPSIPPIHLPFSFSVLLNSFLLLNRGTQDLLQISVFESFEARSDIWTTSQLLKIFIDCSKKFRILL